MDVLSARLRTSLLLAVALPAARMRVGVPPTAHGVARIARADHPAPYTLPSPGSA